MAENELAGAAQAPRTSRCRATTRALRQRPVLIVALVGVGFVLYQWWWITSARMPGALDVDEAGSIGTSLAFHRALSDGPGHIVDAFLGTGGGPLVPLLSVPFVAVFGRSALSPMLVQPVLVLVSAVGVAGTVRHLAGRMPAIVAGVVTLAMPALVTSSRTYQYSNGVGAAMCLATWALMRSNRMTRPWPAIAFGAACAAMTISRTMAISFLPAMGVAALVAADLRDRRAVRNLALAVVAGMAVALPWWRSQWDYVSTYLLSSGYGDRSYYFGSASITGRVLNHLGFLSHDLRAFFPMGAFVIAVGAIVAVRSALRSPRAWLDRHRDLVAIWAIIGLGSAALLTSANRGIWFSTPLDSVLVACVVATGARLWSRPGSPGVPTILAGAIAAVALSVMTSAEASNAIGTALMAVLALTSLLRWQACRATAAVLAFATAAATLVASVPTTAPAFWPSRDSVRMQLTVPLEPLLPTAFQSDERLASPDMATRAAAAAEWAEAADELDRRLTELEDETDRSGDGPLDEVLAGSRGLMDMNVITVARELGGRGAMTLHEPNTFEVSDAEIVRSLAPRTDGGAPRVLVVVEGRTSPFLDALGWHRLVALATNLGWQVDSVIQLPDRGRIAIYTHPESDPRRS